LLHRSPEGGIPEPGPDPVLDQRYGQSSSQHRRDELFPIESVRAMVAGRARTRSASSTLGACLSPAVRSQLRRLRRSDLLTDVGFARQSGRSRALSWETSLNRLVPPSPGVCVNGDRGVVSLQDSIGVQTPPAALERRTASTIATPAKPSSIVGKVSAGSAKEAVRLATIAVATSV
jgi:hypothetical protein